MTKVEQLRKKLEILDSNSNTINLFEDAIYKLNTGEKLEFWMENTNHIGLNIAGRLTKVGLKAVNDAILHDFREQIVSMTAQNKAIRKELGDYEESI